MLTKVTTVSMSTLSSYQQRASVILLIAYISLVASKAQTNSPPASTNAPPSTEERLDKLESNVNKILTILQSQQAPAQVQTSSSQPAVSASTAPPTQQLLLGPILHIYAVQTPTTRDLPDGPPDTGEIAKIADQTTLFRACPISGSA
jgi:hypothetical protein